MPKLEDLCKRMVLGQLKASGVRAKMGSGRQPGVKV